MTMERWIKGQVGKGNIDAAKQGEKLLKTYGDIVSTPSEALETIFEIPTVSEYRYLKIRKELAKQGFTFIVNIKPISIGQLIMDKTTCLQFGFEDLPKNIRDKVPPQMEVAINPKHPKIKRDKSKSIETLMMNTKTQLQNNLSDDVWSIISMPIQSASVLAQIDFKYREEKGKVFFTDWFGITSDQTTSGFFARIGRSFARYPLQIYGSDSGRDTDYQEFVPQVVVLPRKIGS